MVPENLGWPKEQSNSSVLKFKSNLPNESIAQNSFGAKSSYL